MTLLRFKPSVTVAAVIEHDQRPDHFLLVEEHTPEGLRLNNPAGHLEQGESPQDAVVREVLEETGRVFVPEAFVGVYLARFIRQQAAQDITYVRLAYSGRVGEPRAGQALDEGIVRTVWMHLHEVRAQELRLRSPLVLQCIEDYRHGQRLPLGAVSAHSSLYTPLVM
jgi:8-oxo-dGTP pyrophosphatase MutT (NUDIX family)